MKHNPFSFLRNLLHATLGRGARRPAPAPAPLADLSGAVPSADQASEPDSASDGLTIELPLAAILSMLPSHLQGRLRYSQVGSRTISVPLSRILPQLAHGDVRISFGELRQAAPYLFAQRADEDGTSVQLPLAEIVRRIDPALLLAPTPQERQGAGRTRPVSPPEPGRSTAAPPARHALVAAPELSLVEAIAPSLPAQRVSAPFAPGVAGGALEAEPFCAPPAPARGHWEGARAALPAPAPLPEPPARLPGPAPLVLRLGELAASWPEVLRIEIDQLNLTESQVALPMDLAAQGLKRGRLAFDWQTVRAWIQPPPAPMVSAHDELELELALKVVAPLFLARQREGNKPRQKMEVCNEIPDLFVGGRQPAAPACPPPAGNGDTRPGTAPPALKPAGPAAKASAAAAALGTTPQQLVNRAAQLQGVDGALVALRDGLLVASRFPGHLNADTVAAFLPQIFSKLGQYTQELHMGDLNALEFLVGKVPWKVFRLNEVFFVAFGREGEPLPSAPLAVLATELSHPQ